MTITTERTTMSTPMNADFLKLAYTAVEWANLAINEESPAFPWLSSIGITDPETGTIIGTVVWHGDGYWVFEVAA